MKIKISDYGDMPPIIRQTPGSNGIWKGMEFIVNEPIEEADYWFIMHSPSKKETCKCPPRNIVLITQEPESIKEYPRKYLNQFSDILTCQEKLIADGATRSFPANPWFIGAKMIGRNPWKWEISKIYDDFLIKNSDYRLNKIAVITSNKRFTPGHIDRLNFISFLSDRFPNKIDIYGSGFREIKDKFDVYTNYQAVLVIENSRYTDYWTEKLADCYLADCFPIYYGCPNVGEYFHKDSYIHIDIHEPEDAAKKIEQIFNDEFYDTKLPYIRDAKNLVLNKYNVFNVIYNYINQTGNTEMQKRKKVKISPLSQFENSLSLRIKRRIKKILG